MSLLLSQAKTELINFNTYTTFAETLNIHFEKEEALKSAINKAAAARTERNEVLDLILLIFINLVGRWITKNESKEN